MPDTTPPLMHQALRELGMTEYQIARHEWQRQSLIAQERRKQAARVHAAIEAFAKVRPK
jgi:hypothetical protein